MGALLETLKNLGPLRLVTIGVTTLLLVVFFIFIMTRLSSPQMQLLYSDLDTADAAQITQQLDAKKIPYIVGKDGTEIRVPADKVNQSRLEMAAQGLPGGGSIGYEIFDESDALGSTNFVQNVNLVRALEGELARTIRSIRNVKAARVHLVLPRRELFSREKQKPSASIVLRMKGQNRLPKEQIMAVQHLVAAAVPGLTPTQISIVDDKGNLLARGFEDEGKDMFEMDAEARRMAYETRLSRTVEELLEKSVGFGKVRAEVRADMDFNRVTTAEESYDPDGQVVRSTQSVEENASSKETEGELPVSVGNNLPDGQDNANSAGSSQNESRTEETVNFEISKKVTNAVLESGVVHKLSVAILVDGNYTPDAEGEKQYSARSQEEMEQLGILARTAIGFNADRGDSLEVINMKFAEPPLPEEEPLELFFGMGKNDLLRMAEFLVLGIVAILIILLVVRPLISRAFEAVPSAAEAAEAALFSEQTLTPALAGPEPGPPGDDDDGMEELIDIDRVEGRVKASSVKKVGEIVEKHPEEALAIIRTWMYQEG
ncbi:MAG: flagellar basal-body MS-ring/collar protein FliF [Rhodospirillales bacterium]|nr:flagellar basal-body MS-ring/collar protein FliF [Rhodospirillales bacterium]